MEETKKPFNINIFLNEPVYIPGDTVQGEVELVLRRRMLCDLITVQLYGCARVFFVSTEVENGSNCPLANEQKKVLIDEKKILWGSKSRDGKLQRPTLEELVKRASSLSIQPKKLELNNNDAGFSSGRHKMQFTFDLPKYGLSVSYADHDCSVRYFIKVQCYNYQQLVAVGKYEFPIVCPVSLATIPQAVAGKEHHETIALKKGNSIGVTIKLKHCGFVPGERIPVSIRIDNNSLHSIKYAHLAIAKELCGFATYPYPTAVEYESDTTGVGLPILKIIAGQSFEYSPEFNVPALVPNFELDSLLRLTYSLKLDISYVKKCSRKKDILRTIKIPIYIGTVPLDSTVNVSQPSNSECGLRDRFNYSVQNGHQNYVLKCYGLSSTSPPTAPPGYTEDGDDDEAQSFGSEDSCPSYSSLFSSDRTGLLSDAKKK